MRVAVGVGVQLVVLPRRVLRSDLLHDVVQVGVAAGLAFDRRHPARRVGYEHGAQAVAKARVVERLLRVGSDVEDFAVALGVEHQLLVSCLHGAMPPARDRFIDLAVPVYGCGRSPMKLGHGFAATSSQALQGSQAVQARPDHRS